MKLSAIWPLIEKLAYPCVGDMVREDSVEKAGEHTEQTSVGTGVEAPNSRPHALNVPGGGAKDSLEARGKERRTIRTEAEEGLLC